MSYLATLFGASLLLSTTAFAQSKIWVVDDDAGPGVDFAEIQLAINAASAGDMVLVHDGTYLPFAISGVGLSVVADEGASVLVEGVAGAMTTLVSGVPASGEVVIRGIHFRPPIAVVDDDLVRLESSAGVVWLEDVELESRFVPFGTFTQVRAMSVENCQRVIMSRARITGQNPSTLGFEVGSLAVSAKNSTLSLFDCDIIAAQTFVLSGRGRAAIQLDASMAFLRQCRVTGGLGGEAFGFGSQDGGDGGAGVTLGTASLVVSVGSVVVGGLGGGGGIGGGSNGAQGPSFQAPAGTVFEFPAADVRFKTQSVVRSGHLATFVINTEPNAGIFVLTTATPDPQFSSLFPGVTGVGFSPVVTKIGQADALGQLTFTTPVVPLAAHRDSRRFTFQLAAITSTGVELSEPSIVRVIQDRF